MEEEKGIALRCVHRSRSLHHLPPPPEENPLILSFLDRRIKETRSIFIPLFSAVASVWVPVCRSMYSGAQCRGETTGHSAAGEAIQTAAAGLINARSSQTSLLANKEYSFSKKDS